MTPNTPMPFGAFQGQKIKDVPDLYLTKLSKSSKCPDDLKEYITVSLLTSAYSLQMSFYKSKSGSLKGRAGFQ